MEQLLVIIQQIYELLDILNSYTQGEREELLERYPRFLFEVKELLTILDRIVGGSTYWGWKIDWGCQPWHLMTYRQQKGLTLQAGWEDKLDFGLDLYRDIFEASLKILTPVLSPRVLTPIDLDTLEVKDTELDLPTDVCKLTHIEHCTVSLSVFAGPKRILRRFYVFAEEPRKSTITTSEPCSPVFKEAQPRPSEQSISLIS